MTTSLAIDQQQEALLKIRDFGLAVIEIGILNGAFQTEKQEIEQKIEILNRSLRQLE